MYITNDYIYFRFVAFVKGDVLAGGPPGSDAGGALPDTVLEKIYHLNAERLFRHFQGVSVASERGGNG